MATTNTPTDIQDIQIKLKMIPIIIGFVFSIAGIWFGMIQTDKTEDQKIIDIVNKEINILKIENIELKHKNEDQDRDIRELNDKNTELNNKIEKLENNESFNRK